MCSYIAYIVCIKYIWYYVFRLIFEKLIHFEKFR